MYPTFTGNSRRIRNVNLSGQNKNPFATAWAPSTGTGASKTVSNAQAERQQRQHERERLKAAKTLQGAYRSHRVRRQLRASRRQVFDSIYSSSDGQDAQQRVRNALPLLLAVFESGHDDDYKRLHAILSDIAVTDLAQLFPDDTCRYRFKRLVEILVNALGPRCSSIDSAGVRLLVDQLARIANYAPQNLSNILPQYYKGLAHFALISKTLEGDILKKTIECATAPLSLNASDDFTLKAYEALAFNFLTTRDLGLVEQNITVLGERIDVARLGSAITTSYVEGRSSVSGPEGLCWLLAHFIDLHRTQQDSSIRFEYLRALHTQLSGLTPQISIRLPLKSSQGDNNQPQEEGDSLLKPFPAYVSRHIGSLVDRAGITDLLTDLTANLTSETGLGDFQGASLLAGYIITLLQCFPGQGDEIRMRLFLGDIPSRQGNDPVLKFLWNAMSHTRLYQQISRESTSIVGIVQAHLSGSPGSRELPASEQEWRLIVLFLELYTFILRLSDDDDFFSSIEPSIAESDQPPSRLRSCGLNYSEVMSLTVFLKNLAFTLHYNAAEILQGVSSTLEWSNTPSMSKLDAYFGSVPGAKAAKERQTSISTNSTTLHKPSLQNLRTIVTAALCLLYERDSRRPFLPSDHWLMTSKFDMEGFVTAVVSEQERQQNELAEDNDEEEEQVNEDVDEDMGMSHTMAGQRLSRHAQIEHLRAQQRRAQRDRLLSVIGPKLEILRHMPFVIPFETRVQIFRQFIHLDKNKRRGGLDADQWRMTMIHNPLFPERDATRKHRGTVRRENEFEDAYEQFYDLGEGLKEPLQIQFVDTFGDVEEGIDGGGVTKEFLISAIDGAFPSGDDGSVNGDYFTQNSQHLVYPNPSAIDAVKHMFREEGRSEEELRDTLQQYLRRFEFLGRLVGKCMYEGILIDKPFAGFFLLKWASGQTGENSYRGNVNDLRDLDEEMYQGLLRLKNFPGNVADLDLDFTIEDQVSLEGPLRTVTRDLIPNGSSVTVTNENRLLYISYTARHRLVAQPAQQTAAFLRGLRSVIAPSWLSMFNQNELQRLVGGDSSEIDVEDLRRNTVYSGLYAVGDDGRDHPTIELFWKVVNEFSDKKRRLLLSYVTSTPRAPLLGFSQLNPRFSIRDAGHEQGRLPSTSTCVNLLKLPLYEDEETLRERLERAITSQAGFGLS